MSYDIYPTLPSAPLDEATFNKSRAQVFLATIEQLEHKIIGKCEKLHKLITRLNETAAASSALSIITAGSTIATTVTVAGIPISIGLGTVSIASSATSMITNKLAKVKSNKRDRYLAMLSHIIKAKTSYEYAFSKSLSEGINLEEFSQLQKIYVNLLNTINSKKFDTSNYLKDLQQDRFLQQVAAVVAKK